jgi:hypothetical protein
MRKMFISIFGLLWTACASDLPADTQAVADTEDRCGTYSYLTSDLFCECAAGYEWCNPELQDDVNCCAIDSFCGSGICDPGESASNCPDDCEAGVTCGDRICSPSEAQNSCPADCGAPSTCGDGECAIDESQRTCPGDCTPEESAVCGNRLCEVGETPRNCPSDCQETPQPSCGNGTCDGGESASTCPSDCASVEEPTCGDGVCEVGESASSCSSDCAESACTQFECLEERCFAECSNLDLCGQIAPDDLSQCYSYCANLESIFTEWLDPRIKVTDCIEAGAASSSCLANSSCDELADATNCAREYATVERECALIPFYVDVTFLAALMGPTAPNGCQWDGPTCSVSQEILDELGDFIASATVAALLGPGFIPEEFEAALGRIVSSMLAALFSSTAPPDIFGSITLRDSDVWAASDTRSFGVTNNSFRVDLNRITFRRVRMDRGVLATLRLFDEDVNYDDSVGPVNLDRNQFITAWLTDGNAWVLVADGPNDQVLQVEMQVVPSPD